MKKILLSYRFKPEGLTELQDKFEIVLPEDKNYFTKEEVIERIADFEVFVPNFSFITDKDILEKATKLELVSNYGVGFNNIDVDYCTQHKIAVTNIPHSVLEPTAEFAFGLLMAAGRRIGYYDRKIRTSEGVSWGVYGDAGVPIYGKTLGIIGMGRIGQAVARRAIASGMTILYNNRNRLPSDIEQRYNARYVDVETLLRESDYVSLNAPYTPETHKMIGEREFAMMKPTAVFVNTARGSMVDEKALLKTLKEGRIFAAALDVYENEPNINPEFFELDNVLLAPHAGSRTVEDRIKMAIEMAHNIIGFYEGSYPVSRVNPF